jgi:hypothetical protein
MWLLTEHEWRDRATRIATSIVWHWRHRESTHQGQCEKRANRQIDPSCCDSPAENASDRERAALAKDALCKLNERDRRLIDAVWVDGMSVWAASNSIRMGIDHCYERLTAMLTVLPKELPASFGTPRTVFSQESISRAVSRADVASIRKRWSQGATLAALAKEHRVNTGTISSIWQGVSERYKHLTPLGRNGRRLSKFDLEEIRNLRQAGRTFAFIAERFARHVTTIKCVVLRKLAYANT